MEANTSLSGSYDLVSPSPSSVLLPVLQAKAKRGPPRQAKYAIHCIHAMFTNRDTHFAQIFEVSFTMWTHITKTHVCLFISKGSPLADAMAIS